MSLHKTLKTKSALARHRNVLSRAERVEKLQEDEKWSDDSDVFGLPKVAHRKVSVGGKSKKEAKTDDDAATTDDKKDAAAAK